MQPTVMTREIHEVQEKLKNVRKKLITMSMTYRCAMQVYLREIMFTMIMLTCPACLHTSVTAATA